MTLSLKTRIRCEVMNISFLSIKVFRFVTLCYALNSFYCSFSITNFYIILTVHTLTLFYRSFSITNFYAILLFVFNNELLHYFNELLCRVMFINELLRYFTVHSQQRTFDDMLLFVIIPLKLLRCFAVRTLTLLTTRFQ